MRRFPLLALAGLALALLFRTPAAQADDKLNSSITEWHGMDVCAHQAFEKYPDYTRQSNLDREAYRRACLRRSQLPAPDTPLPAH